MSQSAVDDLEAAEDHIGTLYEELRRVAALVPVRDPGRFCRCDIDIYDESDGPDVCQDEDCGCTCGLHADPDAPAPEPWPVVDPASSLVVKLGDGPDWNHVLGGLCAARYTCRVTLNDGTGGFAELLEIVRDDDGFEMLKLRWTDDYEAYENDLAESDDPESIEEPGPVFVRIDAIAAIELF